VRLCSSNAQRPLEHHRAKRERQRAAPPLGTRGRRGARDRRRGQARETGALARVSLLCLVSVAFVEKTAPSKVLRHPVARPLEHLRDVARRQVRQRAELERAAAGAGCALDDRKRARDYAAAAVGHERGPSAMTTRFRPDALAW
jgi:hypothetical protein